MDQQATDTPGLWQRTQKFGENTLNNYLSGGKLGAQGLYDLGAGVWNLDWRQSLGGGADTVNGIARMLFSGVSGAIQGYAGPEISNGLTSGANTYITASYLPLSVDEQYAKLQNFNTAQNWLSNNDLSIRIAEAGLNIWGINAAAGTNIISSVDSLTSAIPDATNVIRPVVDDMVAEEIGILRDAARGKGNFGLGTASAPQAQTLGEAWVGEGYTVASDGKTLISQDGLRQYRPPSSKPNSPYAPTGVQANFEQRFVPEGRWQSNGHLDITP
jgi:hypothetical protein